MYVNPMFPQVQSLGLSMRADTGLSEAALALLFSLEVRLLVDRHLMEELPDIQEAYELSESQAMETVEAVCRRYMDQSLNLALRAAKLYEEADCVKWTREVMRYSEYVAGPLPANGQLFSEDDKRRLISFYLAELDAAEEAGTTGEVETSREKAGAKLRELISLSKDYIGPSQGMEGLLGQLPDLEERAKSGNANSWAWG